MLSSLLAAGRGIRTNCGASCPFGSLDRGGCGLVVGDDPPCCLRPVSIPLGVVFQKWRYAARISPQTSVFKAVKPLSYTVISTFRTLPKKCYHLWWTASLLRT